MKRTIATLFLLALFLTIFFNCLSEGEKPLTTQGNMDHAKMYNQQKGISPVNILVV